MVFPDPEADAHRRVRLHSFTKLRERGERRPLLGLTCYDFTMAHILDSTPLDFVLVGDSAANTVLGYESTQPIALEEIIFLSSGVARGCKRLFVVADLPFGSYEASDEQAVLSAVSLVKRGGAAAVKLEGGSLPSRVAALVKAGIPVMGHIGFTPQRVHQLSGYRVQGRQPASALRLRDEAEALVAAGVFALVLEMVPALVAAELTALLPVPTIGVGAGPEVDGQLLVSTDLLGLSQRNPSFAPPQVDLSGIIGRTVATWCGQVAAGEFPGAEHIF